MASTASFSGSLWDNFKNKYFYSSSYKLKIVIDIVECAITICLAIFIELTLQVLLKIFSQIIGCHLQNCRPYFRAVYFIFGVYNMVTRTIICSFYYNYIFHACISSYTATYQVTSLRGHHNFSSKYIRLY